MGTTPPADETFQPNEAMTRVSSKDELKPGDVIRVWNGYLSKWTPMWWSEISKIEDNKLHLRDLKSGEEIDRTFDPSMDQAADTSTWKHPNPKRVKMLGQEKGKGEKERLDNLRKEYESSNFAKSTEEEMIERISSELAWRNLHDSQISEMEEEFDIRVTVLKKIGEELNKRGGLDLMRDVFKRANGDRSLEMIWGGIGKWMA